MREVEVAGTVLKPVKIHLRLAFACEGGGGGGDDVEIERYHQDHGVGQVLASRAAACGFLYGDRQQVAAKGGLSLRT